MDIQSSSFENNPSQYLPKELFLEISHYLDPKDLVAIRNVCKLWKDSIDHEELWKYQSERKWPDYTKLPNINWIEHFQANYKGSFYGCLNYYDSDIMYACNQKFIYKNLNDGSVGEETTSHLGSINQLIIFDFPKFSTKFITCGSDGCLKIWDDVFKSQSLLSQQIHSKSVNCVEILKNTIFTGSDDHLIKVWQLSLNNVNEKNEISLKLTHELKGHQSAVTCLQVNNEGPNSQMIFSGSRDSTICVWKMSNHHIFKLNQVLQGHKSTITVLKFHSRANCLISGSCDQTIKIWRTNPKTNQLDCVQTLNNHTCTITSLLADPFESIFYSAGLDGRIIGWRYINDDKEWIAESINFNSRVQINSLKFKRTSPINRDYKLLCSLSSDKTIILWKKTQKNTLLSIEDEIIQ